MMTMVTIMMLVVLVVVVSTGRRFLSLFDFLSKIFTDVIKLQILSVVDVNVGVDGTVTARVVVAVVSVVFVVVVGSLSVSDSIRRYNVVYFVGQRFDLAAARKCFQIEVMGSILGRIASLWFLLESLGYEPSPFGPSFHTPRTPRTYFNSRDSSAVQGFQDR